ncbi:lipoprotein [Hoeflea sp. AS60]|uniref:LPS translocon maturation chaperone LptM n=1 Tax=Hoeflea sp. AS60 TaxID=3135780 RepID=UPI003180AED0
MTSGPWIKTICAVALLSAILTGCGRRGALERPGVTVAPAATAEEASTPAAKERHFILDGLLE